MINSIKEYAKANNVPIIEDESIKYIIKLIKNENIKSILEIGTAIGYSAIKMASVNKNISITTIEKNKDLYLIAVDNINKTKLSDQINIMYKDALEEIELDKTFDLIFIDAAKTKNTEFFNTYKKCLKKNGIIITDNIEFHGLIADSSDITNIRIINIIDKIKEYIIFLKDNPEFNTQFISVGDGLAISRKK